MDIVRFPRSGKVYIPLLVFAAILLLFLPRTGKFKYDYRKGAPWQYETLTAEFDFPVLKTEAQLISEMMEHGAEVLPFYRENAAARDRSISAFTTVDLGSYDYLRQTLLDELNLLYSSGIVAGGQGTSEAVYIGKNERVSKTPRSEVYTLEEARTAICECFGNSMQLVANADSLCRQFGLYDAVEPNYVYDQARSEQIHEAAASNISLTSGVVKAGTVIVGKDEQITDRIEQLLDSYKAEYERSIGYSGPVALLWLANTLLSLLLAMLLFFVILYTNKDIFLDTKRYLYLLMIVMLTTVAVLLVDKTDPGLLYIVPFALAALYMLAFFRKRVVLPVYIVSLLPLLVFAHNGVELFMMNLFAGIICIYSFGYFSRGWRQFVNAFVVFLTMLVVWAVFRLLDDVSGLYNFRVVIFMALASVLLVGGYPMVYLFEKMFALVSNTRLQELCDTNSNELLRELSAKAPGTFQHSLQVMNMCDAAANAIGANVALVRAGAMYHDIGKTMNPLCFVENTSGSESYHDGLTPMESAKSIVRHVTDGIGIADKYRLPAIIKSFIITHHGTTSAGYFYGLFLRDGGDPASEDAKEFFYKGEKPSSKEQVILMLCDSIEAAARSLDEKTTDSLSAIVDKIIQGKIADGQIEDSDITMKELNIVREVVKEQLYRVYHPRIAYPAAPVSGPEQSGGRKGKRLARRQHDA